MMMTEGNMVGMMMMMVVLVSSAMVVNGNPPAHGGHHPQPHPQPHHAMPAAVGNNDKMLSTICGAATYKDACMKSLQSVGHAAGATPQTYVEAGVKLALDEMEKASKMTEGLLVKAGPKKGAMESCKHLLDQAKERLQDAMKQVCDANNFKDQAKLFDLRIRLGDVNTFATTCVDEMSQSGAPADLQRTLKAGTAYATELSVNMLDVVTVFNQALADKVLLPTVGPNTRRLLSAY